MPRTKGGKNKPKITTDFTSQIAEKQESIASLTAEITSITANIDTLKVDLKKKKTALKSAQKELTKLESKKATADQKAAAPAVEAKEAAPAATTATATATATKTEVPAAAAAATTVVNAPVAGHVIALDETGDPVFASRALGEGRPTARSWPRSPACCRPSPKPATPSASKPMTVWKCSCTSASTP